MNILELVKQIDDKQMALCFAQIHNFSSEPSFGISTLQRTMRIGFNKASRAVREGLDDGFFVRLKDCEYRYTLNSEHQFK